VLQGGAAGAQIGAGVGAPFGGVPGAIAGAAAGSIIGGVGYGGLGNQGQAYHFNMENSSRVVTDLKAAGVNVFGDTRLVLGNHHYTNAITTGSYEELGMGLHAIQDIFAHGNKGVPLTDTDPSLLDSYMALLGIADHQGNFIPKNQFDNEGYDWADCTLTKVSSGSGIRLKSTELASKAYIVSAYYEMGH